jgi:hypothetical protein
MESYESGHKENRERHTAGGYADHTQASGQTTMIFRPSQGLATKSNEPRCCREVARQAQADENPAVDQFYIGFFRRPIKIVVSNLEGSSQ